MMKFNKWTLALSAVGMVSVGAVVQAEEAKQHVMTALSSTTLSGYVDTSAIWKFGSGNASMPGRAFDGATKMDGFNLNVVSIVLDKGLDEGQWTAGYHVGLLLGPDGVGYNSSPMAFNSDLTVKDAYVMLRAPVGNGIDLKVGTFATPIGYESFESGSNPNYSRSYGWQLEPTQHTGVLASYQVSKSLGFSAGIADTWSAGINSRKGVETQKTYLASVSYTVSEGMGFLSGTSIYGGIVNGLGGNVHNTTSYYAGATIPSPVEGLALGVAYDYVNQSPTGAGNNAYAIAGYVSYQAAEKLKLNGRIDYTNGDDGVWGYAGKKGNNKLVSYTATADYSLWANVISRAELRWDHALGGDKVFGDGTDKNALTLAANIIYKF